MLGFFPLGGAPLGGGGEDGPPIAELAGSATITFGGSGFLSATVDLSASATITFGGSALLEQEFTELAGSATITFGGSGSMSLLTNLSASGTITFGGSATLIDYEHPEFLTPGIIAVEISVASGNPVEVDTHYFSTAQLVTSATDTPASTAFQTRLKDPGSIGRHAYSDGKTGGATRLEVGEIVLDNTDGHFDEWGLWHVSFAGRDVVIRFGNEGDAYPDDWGTLYVGTMESVDISLHRVSIRLRDSAYLLSNPVSQNVYLGNNVLPDGLEGTEDDLKGRRKPKLYGTVFNIAPPCVNTSKLIYQVNDGAVDDVGAVYDRGAPLEKGTNYTSQSDMMNNEPDPGFFRVWPEGGYFRLGATPDGQITAYGEYDVDLPPIAEFSGDVLSGSDPLSVDFTDESTGATSWLWDFGDGDTSTSQNPTHVYDTPGTYTVTLTVTNEFGQDSEVKEDYITVEEAPTVGELWTWGESSSGQLGNGTATPNVTAPAQIGAATDWEMISAGGGSTVDAHVLAIRTGGTLWAWGESANGRLGNGTTTPDVTSPAQIGSDTDWAYVSAGYFHSLAIKTDGTLHGWGFNDDGRIGDGTETQRTSPVQVGVATDWESVCAGSNFSAGIKTDGTLFAWGNDTVGQCGNGIATDDVLSPTQVGVVTTWASLDCGAQHIAAIRDDGTLWTWGGNSAGMLGQGDTTNRTEPTQVGSDANWLKVSCGSNHTVAVKTTGALWGCGWNNHGQVGDGTTTQRNSLVQIGSDTDWVDVSCGGFHTLARKSDGSLWAWGDTSLGQVGNGVITPDATEPVQIGVGEDWIAISGGFNFSVGLREP